MKPAPLVYERPQSVRDAVAMLTEMEWGARVIAGGQSLVPMLNLRLAPLVKLVDISRIAELREAREDSGQVIYGACIRHGEFEDGVVPDAANGLMRRVASRIAYRAIRNRGTIGGSVSLADPSADWVAALIALDARFNIAGPDGNRTVEARDMFLAPYSTALGDHDILTSVAIPKLSSGAVTGYHKIVRKAGEYPMTICAVVKDVPRGRSNVVVGSTNRVQIRLSRSSDLLSEISAWSEQARDSLVAAFREDIADAGRTNDPCELKLCETTVLRAVQQTLEPA